MHQWQKREWMKWTKSVVNRTNVENAGFYFEYYHYNIHTNHYIYIYTHQWLWFLIFSFYSGSKYVWFTTRSRYPIILRNQKDRASRVSLPPEKRDEMNKKHRESYQSKKGQHKHPEPKNGNTIYGLWINVSCMSHNSYMFLKQYVGCDISINQENKDPTNHGEWLNRNNSPLPYNIENGNISTRLPSTI